MNKNQHRGEIANIASRNSGMSIKEIARRVGVSRSTLYNRFGDPELNDKFLIRLGRAIHYDFTNNFPHLKEAKTQRDIANEPIYVSEHETDLLITQRKYYQLLEKYVDLLALMLRVLHSDTIAIPELRQSLTKELKEHKKLLASIAAKQRALEQRLKKKANSVA